MVPAEAFDIAQVQKNIGRNPHPRCHAVRRSSQSAISAFRSLNFACGIRLWICRNIPFTPPWPRTWVQERGRFDAKTCEITWVASRSRRRLRPLHTSILRPSRYHRRSSSRGLMVGVLNDNYPDRLASAMLAG